MAVTRSSSLVVPPASSHTHYWDHHIFTDIETHFKKELPGDGTQIEGGVGKGSGRRGKGWVEILQIKTLR